MGKDPVLPLYFNDLTTSTQDWTDEEFGAYMRLLIHQWRQGGLPNDYQRLTRIVTSLEKNWPLLKQKFPEVDGMLKNPNMEEIRAKRLKFIEKQKINISKRYQNSTKGSTKTIPLEIENENEIEYELELKDKKGVVNFSDEFFRDCFDDLYLDKCRIVYRNIDLTREVEVFKLKVTGAENEYKGRGCDGIRQAFLYHLKTAKSSPNHDRMRNLTIKDLGL